MTRTKKCTKCGEVKPLSEFAPNKNKKDGRQSWCRKCNAAAMRKAYTPDKERLRNLKRRYKMTTTEYEDMLCLADARCMICHKRASEHKAQTGGFLHIDHCHETGEVRGILCHVCNRQLGRMESNPKLMTKEAAVYLLEYYRRQVA